MGRSGKIAAGAGLAIACTLGLAQPAAAHDDAGVAVAAGILGLGVGAAIASDHPHYYHRRHYYYAPPPPVAYYPPPYAYYYAPPPPPRYYGYYPQCGWDGCW